MKTLQRIVALLIAAIIIIAIIWLVRAPKVVIPPAEPVTTAPVAEVRPIDLCFYNNHKITATTSDIAWLKATITGNKITGELRNIPYEKDSKVGLFDGTILPVDALGVRKVDAIWQTRAEGMKTPEQLIINISSEKAEIGFGEMIDRGDGTYVYKTPDAIASYSAIPSASCTELNERITVEQYIRDNIAMLSSAKTTLGGKWYVASITLDLITKKGTVSYEDGHSQKKAVFDYSINTENNVIITNFK